MADFDLVLKAPKDKRLVQAAFYRGQLYLQRGDTAKALADFDLVIADQLRIRPVYLYRARIHFAQGNDVRGLADLDAYLTDNRPFDPRTWEAHDGQRGRAFVASHVLGIAEPTFARSPRARRWRRKR